MLCRQESVGWGKEIVILSYSCKFIEQHEKYEYKCPHISQAVVPRTTALRLLLLKRQCYEILDLRFFHQTIPPGP
jgi:hypothetical protein